MHNSNNLKNESLSAKISALNQLQDMEVQSKSEKGFSLTDFSFSKSKKNLENFKGSLSETLVEERRIEQ